MNKSDVVVIGCGLSGMFAAMTIAKMGKKVTVIAYGSGTYPLNSGLIDALGYNDAGKLVDNPMSAMDALAPSHPYKKIGTPIVREAFDFFKEVISEYGYPYSGSIEQQNYAITSVGILKPTCLLPASMDASTIFNAKHIVVAGLCNVKDYYAELVLDNLRKNFGEDKIYSTISLKSIDEHSRDLSILDVARFADSDDGYQVLLSQLKPHACDGVAFVIPPILGVDGCKVYSKLSNDLGCPLIETTCLPPSVNGMRLKNALKSALSTQDVNIIENALVKDAIFDGNKVVAVNAGGMVRNLTYYADKFILATGGFYSGGLEMRNVGHPFEPIFGLDIEANCTEASWVNKEVFAGEKQGFALAGIKTDSSLRPFKNGNLVENVHVVGRNLSGYDFCFEHSGNGVALASAYKVAKA